MSTLSTDPEAPSPRGYLYGIIGIFLLSCGLLSYLFTPSLPAGDAAAYLDQAAAGDLARRTLHLGYLVQLWPITLLFGDPGAALLSALWGASVPVALALGSARLLPPGRPRALALAAPLVLLGARGYWTESLFPEVYGPAAAALVWSATLRLQGRTPASAVLAGVAIAMHPGSLAWLPGILFMGPRETVRRRAAYVVAALAIPVLFVLSAPGDFLLGERGLLSVLAWPDPWNAVQRGYRATAGAYPLLGVLLLVSLVRADVRVRAAWPLLMGLVLSGLVDWRDDVPASLPAVYLAPLLAGPALAVVLGSLGARPAVIGVLALLAAAQIGEATSAHDRARRIADREVTVLRELAQDAAPPLPHGTFGEAARYRHYVDRGVGPVRVQLPPGRAFAAGACPEQRSRETGEGQVFLCPRAPGATR